MPDVGNQSERQVGGKLSIHPSIAMIGICGFFGLVIWNLHVAGALGVTVAMASAFLVMAASVATVVAIPLSLIWFVVTMSWKNICIMLSSLFGALAPCHRLLGGEPRLIYVGRTARMV